MSRLREVDMYEGQNPGTLLNPGAMKQSIRSRVVMDSAPFFLVDASPVESEVLPTSPAREPEIEILRDSEIG